MSFTDAMMTIRRRHRKSRFYRVLMLFFPPFLLLEWIIVLLKVAFPIDGLWEDP